MSGVPDYALESTLDFKFTSRSFLSGIPTQLLGSPAVEIYEDNNVGQITSAETLTVNFDGVTGLNNLRVSCTAANGFEAGKSYSAVLSSGTVGGVSVVGEVVAQWSIERSAAAIPTDGSHSVTLADSVSHGGSAATLQLGSSSGSALVVRSSSGTAAKIESTAVLGAGIQISGGNTATVAAGEGIVIAGSSDSIKCPDDFDIASLTIGGQAHTPQTGDTFAQLPTNFGDLAITATTGRVDVGEILGSAVTETSAGYAAAGFSYWFDVATPAKTMNDAGVAGSGLSAQDVWEYATRTLTSGAGSSDLLKNTTIATLTTQTVFSLTDGSTDDDAYTGALVIITDAGDSDQKAVGYVADYDGSTKTVTLSVDPNIYTMAAGDTVDVIAKNPATGNPGGVGWIG